MAHITFCQMTQNRLPETINCVNRVLHAVDKVVIVDGGSIDDSIFYMRNWAEREPKLNFFLSPWRDDFSWQRNNYLKHVPDNTWALVSDPDEVFMPEAVAALQQCITDAEKRGCNMVGFQCRSVTMKGPIRVFENLDTYHKRLLFKKFSTARYIGNPHEHLAGFSHKIMDTDYIYEHVKQDGVTWHRGARNLFCGGGGPNLGNKNPRWIDLRRVCRELGIGSWHAFDKYLLKGGIDERLKDWMYKYRDVEGFDGASEHRELWKLYFDIYHPEERR